MSTENSIVASYLAILLGLLAKDATNKELILRALPSHSFLELAQMIEEFIVFQLQAGNETK